MLSLVATLVLAGKAPDTDLTVLAAASLKAPLSMIAKAFELKNPGVRVKTSLAGSQELAAQIRLGAPADLFFSADKAQMDVTVRSGRVKQEAVKPFCENRLCLLVAKRSASRIRSLSDVGRNALRLSLARNRVPVGAYTNQMLTKASRQWGADWLKQVRRNTVSLESNVSSIVARVELGEVDAGVVYETDAIRAGKSARVEIPKGLNVKALYYMATLGDSRRLQVAKRFMDLVLSKEGQSILRDHRFLPPK